MPLLYCHVYSRASLLLQSTLLQKLVHTLGGVDEGHMRDEMTTLCSSIAIAIYIALAVADAASFVRGKLSATTSCIFCRSGVNSNLSKDITQPKPQPLSALFSYVVAFFFFISFRSIKSVCLKIK